MYQRTAELDNFMFYWSQFLLRFQFIHGWGLFLWLRLDVSEEQSSPAALRCWNSINRKLSFPEAKPPAVNNLPREADLCAGAHTFQIPQRDTVKHSKTHLHFISSVHTRQKRVSLLNDVNERCESRFMRPCQRQVNYWYTGGWALWPFPRQHKHSKPSPVSGSSVCSEENWSLSLMPAAGTEAYFLPFAIVSCSSYVQIGKHLMLLLHVSVLILSRYDRTHCLLQSGFKDKHM